MKMAKVKEGAFIEIALSNGKFSYGRVLGKACYAFYDIYSEVKIANVEHLKGKNVLFVLGVYNHAITKNRWKVIGLSELENGMKQIPFAFVQDSMDITKFEIYDPNTGATRTATKAECLGLECAAVWEPEHVEDRIMDYFEGRPNKWVESLKIKE
jgi:Immunity protein 26